MPDIKKSGFKNPIFLFSNKINRETAQYTSRSAIIVLVTLAYLENSVLNTEPKSAQHRVNAKPIKASSRAKNIRLIYFP